jgi:hypothetical protein
MKRIGLYAGCTILAVALVGCSVLGAISAWMPFGISVLDGIVAVVAPANTKVATDAAAGQKVFNDLDATIASAQAAGAGKTGLPKVIAEISSGISSQQQILTDMGSLGLNLNAKDLGYAESGEGLLIAALQGFETEFQAQAGGAVAAPAVKAMAIKGDCFGYEPMGQKGGPHVWANCDASDPIDVSWEADPQTGKVTPSPAVKTLKLGTFKRQYNALCRKYGHPEKQLHLTLAEHLRLK